MSNYNELKIQPGDVLTREKWNGLVNKVEERDQEIVDALTITADKKIGIGTSTPAVALDIEGSVRLGNRPGGGNNLYFTDHTKDHHYIGVRNWWTDFVSHPNEGWRFKAKGDKDAVFTIKAGSGNVGIGTTEARNMLHVKGNAGILNLEGKDHVYIEFFPLGIPEGRKAWLGFGGANVDKMAIVNENQAPLALGTNNHEMLFLRENGNIGIGITEPEKPLHVYGGAKISSVMIGTGTPEINFPWEYESIGVNTGLNFRLYSPNSIFFHTDVDGNKEANKEKIPLSILKNGNVGIGTKNPQFKLHVGGDLKINGGLYFSDGSLQRTAIRVQTGTVDLGKELRGGDDHHDVLVQLHGFMTKPSIAVSIYGFDANKDRNVRIEVTAQDINRNNFKVRFFTWSDTRIYMCRASWIAIGN